VAPHPADHPGPLAFVEDLDAPELADDDLHHLRRVLRLRSGAPLTVGDGRGRWRPARLGDGVEPTGPIEARKASDPIVCVGFALVKGDKPELVVQKLTELGVDRIVPFRAARSVVRWDTDRAAKAVARLRLVARAAAMQSHRPWLPDVTEVATLPDLVGSEGVAMAERDGEPLASGSTTVLVGPEGGWADEELALGIPRVGLADHVLRAETAAITAGVLLTALRDRGRGPIG
jgi:16S rRNA (uracil1498-N3)-methyltransferase